MWSKKKKSGMLPCTKCLERNWRFSFDDKTRMVTAVCINCEAEVSFAAKQRKGRSADQLRKALMPFTIPRQLTTPPFVRPDNVMPWED
jgi:hypothetical protein